MNLQELEEANPVQPDSTCYPGGKWCLLCGRVYPTPGHTKDCVLSQYVPKNINLKGKPRRKQEE